MFLFNIAQCHRQLNDLAEAAKFYRSYLRQDANAANRDEVRKIIERIEATLAQQQSTVKAPPQTTVAPPPAPPSEPPAQAQLALTASAPARKPARKGPRPWVWAVIGASLAAAAGVALGVGVVYGRPTQQSFMPIEVP